ncbi:MAG TPA: hypothetical protein VH186_06190 [Chloroflexia bacterium]|nr:hypothetical protein [Chloroflexia bacterium]
MRQLPIIYSQRDSRWANQRLGTVNGTTIGSDGCYDTSDAAVAGYFTHSITPAELDDILTNKNLYISGNLMTDDALCKVFPDISLQEVDSYYSIPADLQKLQQIMSDPTLLPILCLDRGTYTHFVVCVDCNGSTVQIADPWTGTVVDLGQTYGDPQKVILKYVVYKGTPVTNQNLQELLNQAVKDRNTNWNCFTSLCDTLEIPVNPNDKQATVQAAIDKIHTLAASTSYKAILSQVKSKLDDLEHFLSPIKL